jgi:predicted outer membrane protein
MSCLKFAAVLLAMGFASTAVAQVSQQTQRDPSATGQNRDQAGRLGAAEQGSDINTFIASCLLIGNQEEVALAQMAVDRAENEQVKQFAQMLIQDHQKIIQQLQPLAKPGVGLNEGAQTAAAGQPSNAQQPGGQQYTANRPNLERGAGGSATVDQIMQLNQQAAQECLQMTKSMLQEKQGAEFDKAFAGMQVGAHVGMLAKLKASEQQASGQLASLVKESQQTIQSHLEQAKQICKDLEGSSNSRQGGAN